MSEPPVIAGAVDPRIAAELPGLGLAWCTFEVADDPLRRSSPALRGRLRRLADRRRGPDAIALRSRPIPHAYRVLFRTLGLEPDVDRIPAEAYLVERLTRGGYPSRGVLADALLIACVETEVGVWALPGSLEPRLALAGERVVVAAGDGTVAPVFASPEPVGHDARALTLYAIVAPAVPAIAVEEALWTAWDVVENG